jgi:predicted nucleic acid-binding protein
VKLDAALQDVTRLGIDSAPLIYLVEAHARYDALVLEVFRQIDEGRFEGVTSVVSLGEVLVQPVRDGDIVLHRQYHELLFDTPRLHTLDIDRVTAENAAELRARYGFRLLDALQVAVAIEERCEAFLTNDRRLTRVTELRVLVLDDLEL